MTKDAQFALRRVIEKYTRNTRFCMICNYVSKIIPALQSRCTRFRFAPFGPDAVSERLSHVVTAERLSVTEDGLKAVVTLGMGDMRRTLNILQSTSMACAGKVVGQTDVYSCTGNPLPSDIEKIAHALLNEDFKAAFDRILLIGALRSLFFLAPTRSHLSRIR
ncbi:Replication factor C (RF-C) subunit [Cymbomonas tetramitiformis]|uniref:Replication factor C (RF-C) subunit n=1 Tax=Cymbomonas tetramitiformis TaxID=36881 RepID=A0AAE0LJK3_9CHLO|nr:Replication factor C (RF-C) subunit [Cymbomonas tetramitiformis]